MNLLLVLPAMGFVLLQAIGQERSITQALVIAQTQVCHFLSRDFIDIQQS